MKEFGKNLSKIDIDFFLANLVLLNEWLSEVDNED